MRIFALSDLHLSFGSDKPMDIFKGWENHTERIEKNWKKVVNDDDFVVICGDTSWALKIEDAKKDFEYIDRLPGTKIILKGNHDFWWSTAAKINRFFEENNFKSIKLLHNNCVTAGDTAICGTRGWLYDKCGEKDERVILREKGRLEESIKQGISSGGKPMVFMHYPLVYGDFVCEELFGIIKKYNIERVFYGHIHGLGANFVVDEYDGVKFNLVSCDTLDFKPFLVG